MSVANDMLGFMMSKILLQ